MLTKMARFWRDENGFIISAELVLVATIGTLGTLVGLHEVATAINAELNDVANAFGALNQGYGYRGFVAAGTGGAVKSGVAGSQFIDNVDSCDNNVIQLISLGYGGTEGGIPAGATY